MAGEEGSCILSAGSGVSEDEARQELRKLLADADFHCTERNRNFLSFVAEETFAGRGASIKAYTIAVEVFGRPSSFDPTMDPIVRIEATRLRAALVRYYEHKPADAIRVELPKGRYIPVFFRERRNLGTDEPEDEAPPNANQPVPARESSRLHPTWRARWMFSALGLLGGVSLGLGVLYFAKPALPPPVSQRPAVAVEFSGDRDDSLHVREAVLVALSRFQTLRLLADDYTQATQTAAVTPEYRILLRLRGKDAGRSIWWQVIDAQKGEAVDTGETEAPANSLSDDASAEELARRLSLRLAGGNGVINSRVLAKEMEEPTLGNGCVLRAFQAMRTSEGTGLADARSCLEQTISIQPAYADAKGVLALLLVRSENYDQPTPALDKALQMVREAAAAAPDSANVAYARMTLEFLYGRADLASRPGGRRWRSILTREASRLGWRRFSISPALAMRRLRWLDAPAQRTARCTGTLSSPSHWIAICVGTLQPR
ncbi:hypothetical protein [Mesorhizobium sp.]|uniref:hypothetical protein n=1 Tax=Mesorhizobium sp. TaxID=1871066 RepID=UPI000FE8B461|nr:hypothetical protein [Mesorhizobium sp.]RWF34912.1 MAG: hypothetical protein EOS44_10765 [Mesorhizobium sp.]